MQHVEFNGLPSMAWSYIQVLTSRKPLLAAANITPPHLSFSSRAVRIDLAHLQRYRAVCGIADNQLLPPAYLHVLAMPLHMRLFAHRDFPVKVLGLVHLRNVIRQFSPVAADSTVNLSVEYNSLRETPLGQEYDLITRAHQGEQLVWEELSTMLARRATPGKRPTIDKGQRNEQTLVAEQIFHAPANIGRRYAWVSGDFNPIHLFDRTAQWFKFKQTVAHGMWSLARCLSFVRLPDTPHELLAEFKLPLYLPGEVVFRQQHEGESEHLTLSTPKGDRLHLQVSVKDM